MPCGLSLARLNAQGDYTLMSDLCVMALRDAFTVFAEILCCHVMCEFARCSVKCDQCLISIVRADC